MTALAKPLRQKIFYLMALLFAVVAPLALLYSRGYVLDFGRREFVSTGGIFVKTSQAGARVLIDSERSGQTSLISYGALVTNLLPRRYAIRVEKEGYRPWQKVARVSDQEVLEFRNIFLPPASITPTAVFRTPRQLPARVVALEGRSEVAVESGRADRPFGVFIVDVGERLARVNFPNVTRWFWDTASQSFVIGRMSDGRTRWSRLSGTPDGPATEEPFAFRGLPAEFSAESVEPHPREPGEFYFFAGGALFLQGRSSVPVPIAEQLHAYAITRERIYFLSRNGFFVESNLNGQDTKILGRKGLFLSDDPPARIVAAPGGDIAVLDSAGGLFLYQPDRDQELQLVAGSVRGVDFSASGDRMLWWDDHRFWIYWMEDNPRQPFDLARTKKQVFYSEAPILQAYLDSSGAHVFFAGESGIRMIETDDRGGVNSYTLVEEPVTTFALDKEALSIFWLRGPLLFRANLKE